MDEERDELKARLLAEAEAAIERMLSKAAEKESLTLTDIEKLARSAGEQLMVEITGSLTEQEGQRASSNRCQECGEKMHDKGRKGRHLITETGEVWLERRYYYCENCRRGFFPPGSATGIDGDGLQSGVDATDGVVGGDAAL